MKFRLNINCENVAFGEIGELPNQEIARILREAADRIEAVDLPVGYTNLHDINGNAVGGYLMREE